MGFYVDGIKIKDVYFGNTRIGDISEGNNTILLKGVRLTFEATENIRGFSQDSVTVPIGSTITTSGNVMSITNIETSEVTNVTAYKKYNTAQYTYTFDSWGTYPATVAAATTISPTATKTLNYYNVSFVAGENATSVPSDVLNVPYGTTITYSGVDIRVTVDGTTTTYTGAVSNNPDPGYRVNTIGWATSTGSSLRDYTVSSDTVCVLSAYPHKKITYITVANNDYTSNPLTFQNNATFETATMWNFASGNDNIRLKGALITPLRVSSLNLFGKRYSDATNTSISLTLVNQYGVEVENPLDGGYKPSVWEYVIYQGDSGSIVEIDSGTFDTYSSTPQDLGTYFPILTSTNYNKYTILLLLPARYEGN